MIALNPKITAELKLSAAICGEGLAGGFNGLGDTIPDDGKQTSMVSPLLADIMLNNTATARNVKGKLGLRIASD